MGKSQAGGHAELEGAGVPRAVRSPRAQEKYEADLKKEIKKLQRYRDQARHACRVTGLALAPMAAHTDQVMGLGK